MALNLQKGNMYGFVTHTWNTVKGKCPHNCAYCYMHQFPQKDMRFDKKELDTYLKTEKIIFVGSSCDMWADDVPSEWIKSTVVHCAKHPRNEYLFQSKNPIRFLEIKNYMRPKNIILATTLETNRDDLAGEYSDAPTISARVNQMVQVKEEFDCRIMITIEPIMDLDPGPMVDLIELLKPQQINIGADSKQHNLPEPSQDTVYDLINRLEVLNYNLILKKNLKRLINLNKVTTKVL